jgi:hypothetical protein
VAGVFKLTHHAQPTRLLGEQTTADPSPPSIKAFDSANSVNDPAWFGQAYAAGFRLYILNTVLWDTCNPWPPAQSQIKDALAVGLKVAAYTRNPECWENGILATGPYQNKLQFFALDIESDPGIPVTKAMVDGVKAMNVRPVIYSGAQMWDKLQGSTSEDFSDLPLWDTNPSDFEYSTWQANYLSPAPLMFGGWNTAANRRIGVQQQLEYTLNAINIDLNSFNPSFLLPL